MKDRLSDEITDLQQELTSLRSRNHWISMALDECPEAIVITSKDGLIEYVNPAFKTTTGYSFEEVAGKKTSLLKSGAHDASFYADLWKTILAGNRWEGEMCNRRKDGTLYWEKNSIAPSRNEEGEITHFVSTKVDITHLKMKESSQQETLFWQKKILETLPVGIAIESGGKIVWVNGKFEEITCFLSEDILGKPIESLFPIRKKVEKLSYRAKEEIAKGRMFQTELKLRHPNNGTTWCSLTAIGFKYGNQQVEIIWLFQNITKRKQVEKKLRESEEMFRNAFSSNASAMYVATYPEGVILEVNLAFEELTGYKKVDAVGHTTGELYIWSARGRKALYDQINVVGSVCDYDAHYYTKSKHKRNCQVSIALVDNSSGPRVFVSFVDTTARKLAVKALKESEEKFRFMAEGINDVISLHKPDMEATISYISPPIKFITGYNPEELKGKSPETLICRDDWVDIITNAMLRMYSGNSVLERIEFRALTKSGGTRWVESTLKPVVDANGSVEMIIAVSRDVSHRKEIEQQLREVNGMKDKFLSIIAHDLRNPFNALLGFSSLLLNDMAEYDSAKIAEFISEIHDAAQGGVKLLDELLQWAMVESGTMTFSPEVVRLSEISKEVFELASIQATAKHLFLVDNISEKLVVCADKRMVATILRNLVTNAIKFTQPGGVVRVSAEKVDSFVAVSVIDTGVGIKQHDLGKLFRIDVKPSEIGVDASGKGSGLGLILCHEFVMRHGGTITAKSIFGQGAEFTFTLPTPPAEPLIVTSKRH